VLGRRSSLRPLRWAIVSFAVLLSVVLLLRGDVIIGGLIGASAVLRITFLLSSSRAGARYGRAGGLGRAGGSGAGAGSAGPGTAAGLGGASVDDPGDPGPARPLLRGLAPQAFEVAARVIGVSAVELHRGFQQSRSIAAAATAKGVSVVAVVAAVVSDASVALDRAVAQGTSSPEVAGRAKARPPIWPARLVYGRRASSSRQDGAAEHIVVRAVRARCS
jgi:hypothetical protein